jgi:sporulation protein YlmC with PRC-barrel domain
MQFFLKNKLVVTETGKVLGEVRDTEVIWPDLRVTKLVLRRSLLGGELLVGVDAIVKVEGERIIVRDALVKVPARGGSVVVESAVAAPSPVMTREQ